MDIGTKCRGLILEFYLIIYGMSEKQNIRGRMVKKKQFRSDEKVDCEIEANL